MKQVSVKDLLGPALDWAVAEAQGMRGVIFHRGHVKIPIPNINEYYPERGIGYKQYHPSTSWRLAGPLMEEEKICLENPRGSHWVATVWMANPHHGFPPGTRFATYTAVSPKVAIARCFVASKLGPDVHIPDQLISDQNTTQ